MNDSRKKDEAPAYPGGLTKVSKKYLPLYVAEFQFRYNNRNNPDIFGAAMKGC